MTRRKPVTKGEKTTGVSQELNKKLRMVEESKMKLVDENDEDDTKVEQLTSTDLKSTQSTRSKRGRTQMHCLSMQRGQGNKIDVKFNENGQPVEQAGTQMQSYIGVLVRERLKITYEDWDSVPTEEKELIWESVNLTFNVDPNWKKGFLKSASSKFRQFKADLARKFIFSKSEFSEIIKPPADYPEISASDWSTFVFGRMSDKWKKLRTEQQERRAKNEYPHGISRKGYAQLAREKPQLLGKNRDINQAVLWGEARKKLAEKHQKAGLKQLPEKLAKLGEYISQKTDGTLDPKDKNCTILQAVLGKPEHPGRLRGVGSDISPTMYYQVGREKDLLPQICQRQEQQLMSQAKRIKKLEAAVFKDGSHDEDTVEKGSCSPNYEADIGMVDSDVEELDKKAHLQGKMVALSLESRTGIAGYGLVMKNQDHELPEECIYVAIDQAVDENAPLPIPTEECKSIGDAVGSHVPWPLHLLKLKDEKPKKKIQEKEKEEKPIDLSNTPAPLRVIYLICKADRQRVIAINIDESLFGQDMCLYVNIEDVKPFCTLEPIAYTCITVYIWHLHTKICREKKAHKFRFINPYHVGHIPSTKVDEEQQRKSIASRTNALAKGLVGTSKSQLVLVPCNVGFHWILTVIDPHNEEIGVLDPLYVGNRGGKGDWKQIVEAGLKTFLSTLETTKEIKSPIWTSIPCPKQPDHVQCGFYVMRYMKDIIESDSISTISSLQKWFKGKKYSIHDIDEVRTEWAGCVQEYI